MRTLQINITDIGGEAFPGDEVLLWSPRVRGSRDVVDRVVSTAPKQIMLTQGRATVEVEPGEIFVQLRCRGVADVEPRKVVVPEGEGEITLRSLFDHTEKLDPPIVSQVTRILERAEAAAKTVKDVDQQVQGVIRAAGVAAEASRDVNKKADEVARLERSAKSIVEGVGLVKNEAQFFAEEASASKLAAEQIKAKVVEESAKVTAAKTAVDEAKQHAEAASTSAAQAAEQAKRYADQASRGGGGVSEERARAIAGEEIAKLPPGGEGVGEARAREIAAEEVKKLPPATLQGVVNLTPTGDFTTNLQTAINNAEAKRIVLPAGEFQLTTVITLDKLSGKELVGQGIGTIIKAAKNSGRNVFQSTSGGRLTDAVLKDFVVDMGWETGDKHAHAFQLTNATKVKISGVVVKNAGGHAFLLQGHGAGNPGTSHCVVERCTVEGAGLLQNPEARGASGFGVLIKDNSDGNQIINNVIRGVSCGMGIGGSATALGAPEYTLVAGNYVSMADNETIAFECIGFQKACHHTVITGNTLPVSRDNGVSVGSYSLVTNNTIGETWNHGIACSGNGTTISNNTIFNIGLENSTRLVNDPKDWGVICLEDATGCVVTNNAYHQTDVKASAAHMVKINLSPSVDRKTLGGNVLTANIADKALITKEWFKNVNANPANPDILGEAAQTVDVKPAWETWFELDKRYVSWITYWWADQQQPTSNWHPWFDNADVANFAILNPRSGPGGKLEPDFVDLRKRLEQRGKKCVGYVKTTSKFEPKRELRSKGSILTEIATYVQRYRVDGVFLDEMVNGWSEDEAALIPFYKDLFEEIKNLYGPDFLVVGNPGTNTKEGLLECADVLITFEASAKEYLAAPADKLFPFIYRNYSPARFIHVIHNVEGEDQARAVVAKAEKSNVAHLYLTTDTFTGVLGSESPSNNPWDNLPEPWLREVNYAWARRTPLPVAPGEAIPDGEDATVNKILAVLRAHGIVSK